MMILTYRLAAAALLLAVAACSQVPTPGPDGSVNLAPQAFGTPQNDAVLAVASYSGGVYAVGNTGGSLYAANRGQNDVFISKTGSDKRTVWNRQFGTPGADGVADVATDGGGNVYVFGSTGGALARQLRGNSDFFLRKYSAAGGVVWTLQFGLETDDYALDLVTTRDSVYVVGRSAGKGLFLYRFNLDSAIWWKRQLRTSLESPNLSLDAAGNVYMAATVEGEVLDVGVELQTSDLRLEKFSGTGALLWARVHDFSEDDSVYQIIAHGSKVYVLTNSYFYTNEATAYLLQVFSGTGERDREQNLEPNDYDTYDFRISNSLRLLIVGSGIYTDTLTDYLRTGDSDEPDKPAERTFKRYRLDGSIVWEKDFPAFGTTTAVAERGTGEVYVGGYTRSAPSPGVPRDALLHKLNAVTGATAWSK